MLIFFFWCEHFEGLQNLKLPSSSLSGFPWYFMSAHLPLCVCVHARMCAHTHSSPTLCGPIDFSSLGSSVELWLGRSPGVGNGSSLQYSCLENSRLLCPWHLSTTCLIDSLKRHSRSCLFLSYLNTVVSYSLGFLPRFVYRACCLLVG